MPLRVPSARAVLMVGGRPATPPVRTASKSRRARRLVRAHFRMRKTFPVPVAVYRRAASGDLNRHRRLFRAQNASHTVP